MEIGAHVSRTIAPQTVNSLKLASLQMFVGSPTRWKSAPVPLKEANALKALNIPIFVHAPYILNPASANPDVRKNTALSLQMQLDNCERIGARGLIIHGGQGGTSSTIAEGIARWQEVLAQVNFSSRLIIENTAGGSSAPARRLSDFALLWNALSEYPLDYCVDTCHSWAAGGFDLDNLQDNLVRELGVGPAVVHLNGSKDETGSGRDRHTTLIAGNKQSELSLEFALSANVPVILETPDHGFLSDLTLSRDRLG